MKNLSSLARYLLLILGIALLLFVLLTVIRVGVFYSLYLDFRHRP